MFSRVWSWYTNLMDHIKRAHLNYVKAITDVKHSALQGGMFTGTVISVHTQNNFSWSETRMGDLMIFTFV